MRNVLVIILLFVLTISFGQTTADRYEISSAGAEATLPSGGNISYTVGGLVVETSSTASMDVTQGFEQPSESSGRFNDVFPPNAFSPDGDGVNDIWMIDLPEDLIDVVDVSVINRWGDQIAFIENYNNATSFWDGTYDGTGKPVVEGTYFYIMEAREFGGKKTGWIQVVRNN